MSEKPLLRILIVDDERPIRRFLRLSLAHDYAVFEAENGEQALQLAAIHRPDLVLLDLGLPDVSGMQVLSRLREWTQTPVIIISVDEHEQEKVAALDAGADDYLTKPFSTAELQARMRVALRHARASQPQGVPVYNSDGLTVNLALRQVLLGGQHVVLTPVEYDILRILVMHTGKVLTHAQIIQAVWGGGYEANAHLLRVNISNLRKKIEPVPLRPRYILTEPGVGYRLQEYEEAR